MNLSKSASVIAGQLLDVYGIQPERAEFAPGLVHLYREYASERDEWILQHLAVPCAQLETVGKALWAAAGSDEPAQIGICVLGRPSHHRETWEAARELDAADLNAFQERFSAHGIIEAYDVRIPDDDRIEAYIRDLQGFSSVEVSAEIPYEPWLDDCLDAIAETEWLGVKAAVLPAQIPDLANLIRSVVSYELPIKFHNGDASWLTMTGALGEQIGVLNLVAAIALAVSEDLSSGEISALIRSSNPLEWGLGATDLRWRGFTANMEALNHARDLLGSIEVPDAAPIFNSIRTAAWE